MKTGIDLITEERQRQITVEGWTPEHDKEHSKGELAKAAGCYALADDARTYNEDISKPFIYWPWDAEWWKPTPDNRVRELVKAGALIAAEIDRIQSVK